MSEDKTQPDEREPTSRAKRISELFQQACELDAEQRESLLNRACAGDAELRAEVESLLKHDATGILGTESLTEQVRGMHAALGTDPQPERIGPYKILQKLGEGGMGIVYEAEQEKPVRRRVAVKVIKRGMDTNQVVARFEAERQALAMMNHPNVAKVFDAGATEQGRPYFAMELVKGEPITKHCDRQRVTTQERLGLFMQVCEGVQHAHQKGIIHRDIKPSNILVQTEDDKRVPKIIDFGVAKAIQQRLTERTLFTELGVLIGTPEYMSPEQAEMTVEDIDTRTDVYSLGVLLYELLVGVLPFDLNTLRHAGFDEMRRFIREKDPPKPSTRFGSLGPSCGEAARRRRVAPDTLQKRLKGEIDWIVLKALEKDRVRRYPSASEFATDIANHLNGNPVTAGPQSAAYHFRKLLRKHRARALTWVAVLLALVASVPAALSLALFWNTRVYREEKKELEGYHKRLVASDYGLEMNRVALALNKGDRDQAEIFLVSAGEWETAPDAGHYGNYRGARLWHGWEWRYLTHRANLLVQEGHAHETGMDATSLLRHSSPVVSMVFTASGDRLLSLSSDGMLCSWDMTSHRFNGAKVLEIPEAVPVSLAVHPAGTSIAVGQTDGTIRILSLDRLETVSVIAARDDDAVTAVAFSPDGKQLGMGTSTGALRILDMEHDKVVTDRSYKGPITALAVGQRQILVGHGASLWAWDIEDKQVHFWTINSWNLTTNLLPVLRRQELNRDFLPEVTSVAFVPGHKRVVSGSEDRKIRMFSPEHGVLVLTLDGHDSPVTSLTLSADGRLLASGSEDGTILIWDRDAKSLATL